nr:MAG TPA: hypothetical protein [Caudoviricetes sp.]
MFLGPAVSSIVDCLSGVWPLGSSSLPCLCI